jgi:hypothetical protein
MLKRRKVWLSFISTVLLGLSFGFWILDLLWKFSSALSLLAALHTLFRNINQKTHSYRYTNIYELAHVYVLDHLDVTY